MKILAQGLRPNTDGNNLSKAPRIPINAVIGEVSEILNEHLEPMDEEAEEYKVH